MDDRLLEQGRQFSEKRRKRRIWKNIVSVLACVVVFCTTYALILPAITMEKDTYCGYVQHKHGEECYEAKLICTLSTKDASTHEHSDECYQKEQVLVCEKEESSGHSHSSECEKIEKERTCGLEESEGHTHTDTCYAEDGTLSCGKEEYAGHTHSDACYTEKVTVVCGKEESEGHAHSDACYDTKKVLKCEKEAGAEETHVHTEECYKEELVCDIKEHEHEKSCYSDKTADVETASDWEKTLPDELTGIWADDVLAVAESQLGYEESTKNFIVTEDDEVKGYSRYGAWYGDPYGHWCAMFVSFCLDYAEVDKDLMPQDANCQNWIETLSKEEYELYHEADDYEPVPGDLIFFNFDEDKASDHVGIVVEIIEETEEQKAQVKTIEGNSIDNNVRYLTYDLDSECIMGYGTLPKNPENEEEEITEEVVEVKEKKIKLFARNRASALTGIWATDLLSVAENEVEAGTASSNYLDWYRTQYGESTGKEGIAFVAYCIANANVDIDVNGDFNSWKAAAQSAGLYRNRTEYVPKPGDIAFLTWGVDDVGIVSRVVGDGTSWENSYLEIIRIVNGVPQRDASEHYKQFLTNTNRLVEGYIEIPEGRLTGEIEGEVIASASFETTIDAELMGADLIIQKLEENETRSGLMESLCSSGNSVRKNYYYDIHFEKNGVKIIPNGNVVVELTFTTPLDSDQVVAANAGAVDWNIVTIDSNDSNAETLVLTDQVTNNDSDLTKLGFVYKDKPVYAFSATQGTLTRLSTTVENVTARATASSTLLSDDMHLVLTMLNTDENVANWTTKLQEVHVTEGFVTAGNQFFKVEIVDQNDKLVVFPADAKIEISLEFEPNVEPSLDEDVNIETGEWKVNTISTNQGGITVGNLSEQNEVTVTATEAFALDKITMLYEPHEVLAVTSVVNDPEFGDKVSVSSEYELAQAIQKAGTNKTIITITQDFATTGTIQIPSGKKIEIDLNGKTISASNTLFSVEGGKLILTDSKKNSETIMPGGSNVVGNKANYSSYSETLTYYVTHSTVTDTQVGATQETLEAHTVKLDGKIDGSNSAGPIVRVTSGTYEQVSGALVGSPNRAIVQNGGTLNLKGGYICGNSASTTEAGNGISSDDGRIAGGAILAKGKSAIKLSGTVLAANTADDRGGAISIESGEGASINITGGVISGNECTSAIDTGQDSSTIHAGGGGVFAKGEVTVNMSGGYITNNLSQATGYLDGGGGIFISGKTVFTLNGGYITGNYAKSGGGGVRSDFWGHHTVFNFNDGFVSSNQADLAEGGGVSINWDGVAYVSGGYITNNVTNTTKHWGGGGLFVSNGAKMYVVHALVTENQAGGFGGGLAGCSTGHVFLVTNKGGAIFNNSAAGTNVTDGSEKAEDKIYGLYNPVFMKSGFNDYFGALTSTVEGNMLGGGAANWKGSADEIPITIGKNESYTASFVMGLTADPSQEGINAAINEAKITNGIYIHNNTSNTHGGGVLCNGYLVVGEMDEIEVGASLEIAAKKSLLNEKEEEIPLGEKDANGNTIEETVKKFKFVIVDEANSIVSTGTNDADGHIAFSARIPFKKTGTFTYYVYEDVEVNSEGYLMDTRKYKLTVTVDVETSKMEDMVKKLYKITHIKVERNLNGEWELFSDSDVAWDDKYEYSPVKMNLTGGATFTNYEMKSGTTKVSVIKKWTGETPENVNVNVVLLQNNEKYAGANAEVTLNSSNNWTYTWNDLPRSDGNGKKYVYTVKENAVEGYNASYEIYNNVSTNSVWVPFTGTSLEEGTEFIVVAPDGEHALYLTPEHADQHLTASDKVEVTKGTGSVSIGGKTYTDYYPTNTVTERMIYKAVKGKLNSGSYGTILQNKSTGSAFLIQPQNGLNLKDGIGVDGGWVSAFYLSEGMLVGYKEWSISEGTNKYIICYDAANEKFEALPNNSTNWSKAAKIYVNILGDGEVSSETSVIITNTKAEEVTYGIEVNKVSDEYVGDAENDTHEFIPLRGAKFELREASGTALRFTRTADGAYVWYSGTLTDEAIANTTTELVTNSRGKLAISGLPAGNYRLVETEAPDGYALAEPKEVTLGENGSGNVVEYTIVDKKITEGEYILPETGGPGTNVYTAGGILLLMISVLLYIKKKNQMKGGPLSN